MCWWDLARAWWRKWRGAAPLTPQGSSVQGEGMAMGAWGRAQEATAVPQTPLEHSSGVGKRE